MVKLRMQGMTKTMASNQSTVSPSDDTVGPILVIPHTPSAMGRSVDRIVEEGVTVVSVNAFGKMMGVLFSDGDESLYWYRAPESGADFGLN